MVIMDGRLVKTNIPTIATREQVVHTLATRMGSKTKWDEKDALALTIIKNCLQNNYISHVGSFDKSKEASGELTRLFEAQDAITKMYSHDKLATLKMRENENMIKHIHAFRSLLKLVNNKVTY